MSFLESNLNQSYSDEKHETMRPICDSHTTLTSSLLQIGF